jgi:hypothetical protein
MPVDDPAGGLIRTVAAKCREFVPVLRRSAMHRPTHLSGFLAVFVASFLAAASLALSGPAGAATAKQKATTCKFYADQQKLAGAKRTQFMAKCTSTKDEPRGPAVAAPGSVPAPAEPEQQ